MDSSQISFWFVFAALAWFSCAQKSCRIFDEELGVNKNWQSCMALCAQNNGSCLVWIYNNETARCVGWMVEGELQSKEKVKSYYNYRRRCKRSGPMDKSRKRYTGDDDASASSPSTCGYSYDEEDYEDYTVDSYYSAFYNTPPESERTEGYYDDPEMTAQDYYNAFYNPHTVIRGTENDDDYEGQGSFDYNFGSSSSPSSHAASHGNRVGIAEPEIDAETRAAIKKRKQIERWTLYDHCHFSAFPTLTNLGYSVRNAKSGCLVLKSYLGKAVGREDCLSSCQNPPESLVDKSCIAWMWWSEEEECEGLFILAVDRNNICGIP